MSEPHYWQDAKAHLSRKDKTLTSIIASCHGESLTLRGDAFYTLARSIVGQQISVKAADSVWNRLVAGMGDIKPQTLASASVECLRACGLSGQKAAYLHALSEHFIGHEKRVAAWPDMSDEEVIKDMTSIHGIGRWTAEMFLIFNLARPDVFPVADIGLQKAVFRYYNNGEKLPMGELRAHGERWKPYRTVATWYLWRALDPVPVAY
jgi:DNA-3-methyladenine glycosylase II